MGGKPGAKNWPAMRDIFFDTPLIARACKIPSEKIGFYVERYNLPAFKDSDAKNAKWKARPEALERWAVAHEKRFLK